MIPAQFAYAAPESLDAAIGLLTGNEGARVLAGGHSLVADMKLRRTQPPMLVDLRKIQGLRGITHQSDGTVRIGAMTTYVAIARAQGIRESHAALAEAVGSIGYPQVRNYGTLGGNLAYAHPAADLPAVAVALEATVNVSGPDGPRSIPAQRFFVAPFRATLGPGEIITSVDFPPPEARSGSAYEKTRHPANGYAVCGVAARVVGAAEGSVAACSIALTGVAMHVTRLSAVEAELVGKIPTREAVETAARRAGEGLVSFTDLYASAEYRIHLAAVLVERALARALQRAALL